MNKQNKNSRSAFTIWEIFVLVFIIGFVAWLATPNFVNPKKGPAWDANRCINNLRQIDAAANQFALEHGKTNGEAIHFPDDLTPYIKLNVKGEIPPCPTTGKPYHISQIGVAPTCTLSTATPAHALPNLP
ncbi:MAG: hypothetical protein RL616_1773 [Verrucomicrobiota bacterium]|jgi:type II secretory pathway pseudopilin PulG